MNTSLQPERTRLFARVLGPYFVIAMAVYVAQQPDLPELVASLDANPILAWFFGPFTLIIGLVMVALHQIWHGAAAIIISVIGWLTILKGVVIMAIPGVYVTLSDSLVDGTALLVGQAVVAGGIGVYLTYVGWRPRH